MDDRLLDVQKDFLINKVNPILEKLMVDLVVDEPAKVVRKINLNRYLVKY
jgi:hypothetical protein